MYLPLKKFTQNFNVITDIKTSNSSFLNSNTKFTSAIINLLSQSTILGNSLMQIGAVRI